MLSWLRFDVIGIQYVLDLNLINNNWNDKKMKNIFIISSFLMGILTAYSVMADSANAVKLDQRGDRIENRLDNKGDRIENRLDNIGDRIEDRLDHKADRASANGHEARADHLENKGDRIDQRLDNKGERIDNRLDRKGERINNRLDKRTERR